MALTPELRTTQGQVLVTYSGNPDLRGTFAKVLVLYNLPAIQIRANQASVKIVYAANQYIRANQAKVLVLYSGRVDTPKLKSMGFNLDGHTFYVIRLGSGKKTLVFDRATNQWSWWCRQGINGLDSHTGINWRSAGPVAANYNSNILLGDANNGRLYIFDPMAGVDSTEIGEFTFPRVATGQLMTEGRVKPPVYQVYLTASLGKPALTANTITLSYSDDQGNTYRSAGSKTVIEGDFEQEFAWRSLGLAGSKRNMGSPGRLFQIEDNGSFARIDSLEIDP